MRRASQGVGHGLVALKAAQEGRKQREKRHWIEEERSAIKWLKISAVQIFTKPFAF